MTTDTSRLSIEVVSNGISEANKGLGELGSTAGKVEKQVVKLTDSIKALSGVQGTATAAARDYASAMQGAASTSSLSAATTQLAASMALLSASLGKVTTSSHQSTAAFSSNTKAMNDAHAAARGLTGSLGALWLTYGNMVPLAVGAAIGFSFKQIVMIGKDVENTLEGIRVRGRESMESIDAMRGAIMDLGKGVHGPREVAAALDVLILAGLNAKEALVGVKDALNLALVGNTTLEKSATTLVQVSTALGFTAEGYGRISDVIAKTAAVSIASVESISGTFRTASVVGKMYGQTLVDIGVQTAVLSNLRVTDGAAGTAIKNFFSELASGSEKVTKGLAMMKLKLTDLQDSQGNFLSFTEVMKTLAGDSTKGFNSMTAASQKLVQAMITNERSNRLMTESLSLVRQEGELTGSKLEDIAKEINESWGFVAAGAAAMALTVDAQFKSVKNTLEVQFMKAFKEIEPQLSVIATQLKTAFKSQEFATGIQSIALALANLGVFVAENIGLLKTLLEAFLIFKTISFAIGLFIGIAEGIAAVTKAAAAGRIAILALQAAFGFLTLALAAAGAMWAWYKLKKDEAAVTPAQLQYMNDFVGKLNEESERLEKQLDLMKQKKTAAQALLEIEQQTQLQKVKSSGLEAIAAKEKEANDLKRKLSAPEWELLNQAHQMKLTSTKDLANINAILKAEQELAKTKIGVAEANKAAELAIERQVKASKAVADEAERQAKLSGVVPEGTATIPGKENKAHDNAVLEGQLKAIQGRIDSERRALKSLEQDYQSQYRRGVIGDIALIELKEAAEIKSSKTILKLLEDKRNLTQGKENKQAVTAEIENHKQRESDREVEAAHRATTQIEDYYSKLQTNIQKAEADGYKARGEHVNAFLSDFGAKHDIEGKRVAHNIEQVQAQVSQAMAAIATGTAGSDVYTKLATNMERLDTLFKQSSVSMGELNAGMQSNSVKEATESFDKLYISVLNSITGVKTASEGLGMGEMLEAAMTASDKYTGSLVALSAAQQKIATAGEGGSAVDQAKAEEALAKMSSLAEVQRKLWVGVGDSISSSLKEAFGSGGQAAGEMIQSVVAASNMQDKIAENRVSAIAKLKKDEAGYADKVADINIKAAKDSSKASLKSYGDMASAAKGFFKEGSSGYKALEAAERVFRTVEMAMTMQAMIAKVTASQTVVGAKAIETAAIGTGAAVETAATGVSVVNAGAQASAWGITAVVKAIASMPFPLNLVAGAVTLAAVVAIGAKMFGGGGGGSSVSVSEQRQKTQGTGTVLGDDSAKSESISKSLEILEDNSDISLAYTSKMLNTLKSINDGISGMATMVSQSSGLRGTSADERAAGVGSSKSFLGFSSKSTTLTDAGIVFDRVQTARDREINEANMAAWKTGMPAPFAGSDDDGSGLNARRSRTSWILGKPVEQTSSQTIGSALAGNVGAHGYTETHSEKSSFFGLSKSSSDNTALSELNADLKRQFVLTIGNMYNGVLDAAGALGKNSQLWESVLQNITFEQAGLTKISLKGLSGADIEKELQAAFSKLGDTMAQAVMPELAVFQKVGEGMFQTLIRVSAGVDSATFHLEKFGIKAINYAAINNKQGDVATELARDSIMAVEGLSKMGGMIADMSGDIGELVDAYADLNTVRRQLQASGLNRDNLSRDMVRGAGGLESLKSGSQSFFDNFLSDQERQKSRVRALSVEFAQLNQTLPVTKDGFRALITKLDNGTASGDALVGKLLSLSDAFNEVADSADDLVKTSFDNLSKSIDTQRTLLEKQRDAALAVYNSLSNTLTALQPMTKQVAQDVLKAALKSSNAGGSLVKFPGLDEALKVAQQSTPQAFATLLDMQKDQGLTANLVSGLKDNANKEVTTAEKSLEVLEKTLTNAQAQLDALNGVSSTLLSVDAALAEFTATKEKAINPMSAGDIVTELYKTYLNREPEAEGKAYWTDQITSGKASVEQVTSAIRQSAEASKTQAISTAPTATAATTSDIVTGFYRKYLEREPDAGGLTSWSNHITSGNMSAEQVGAAIQNSPEGLVKSLYKQYLGRTPDAGGYANWTGLLASGAMNADQVTAHIRDSDEAKARRAAIDGSHSDGLDYVPKDGYIAELHKGERVQTANQAKDSDAVAEEIRRMKDELNAALLQIAQNTGKTRKLNERWDTDGMLFRDVDSDGNPTVIAVNVVQTV